MQAARAARRKERILKSTEDRMAAVSGAEVGKLPISAEKRLVLDDDEMDPMLASRFSNDVVKTVPTTEPKKPEIVESDKKDILDDALDELFETKEKGENVTENVEEKAKQQRKRPARRKVPYAELEAIMAKPTTFINEDMKETKTTTNDMETDDENDDENEIIADKKNDTTTEMKNRPGSKRLSSQVTNVDSDDTINKPISSPSRPRTKSPLMTTSSSSSSSSSEKKKKRRN
eukprot:CAMPEP_0114341948 /NCGR_PEP_ID=MMETSP0101-20121206/9412_1 /TAXON_ID=38822 ORGANISM="Pteridomonas danica, Strain PT" /NCGR_SAMPLE_ID=MMETSP0101 /ASSEMBLY_ACC=CAM_ASM_000211 /LENGTH=231 /DNA_ID=CAMNT_0001475771 /DNA_START=6 /DNA_END=702 /DNA_ORIENTATION=-